MADEPAEDRGVPIEVKVDVDVTFRCSVAVEMHSGESFEVAKERAAKVFTNLARKAIDSWSERDGQRVAPRTTSSGSRQVNVAYSPTVTVRAIGLGHGPRGLGWEAD